MKTQGNRKRNYGWLWGAAFWLFELIVAIMLLGDWYNDSITVVLNWKLYGGIILLIIALVQLLNFNRPKAQRL